MKIIQRKIALFIKYFHNHNKFNDDLISWQTYVWRDNLLHRIRNGLIYWNYIKTNSLSRPHNCVLANSHRMHQSCLPLIYFNASLLHAFAKNIRFAREWAALAYHSNCFMVAFYYFIYILMSYMQFIFFFSLRILFPKYIGPNGLHFWVIELP